MKNTFFKLSYWLVGFLSFVSLSFAQTYKCDLRTNASKIIPTEVFLKIDAGEHVVTYMDTLAAKSDDLPIEISAWVREPGIRMEWVINRKKGDCGIAKVVYNGFFRLKNQSFKMTTTYNGGLPTGKFGGGYPSGWGQCKVYKGKFPTR